MRAKVIHLYLNGWSEREKNMENAIIHMLSISKSSEKKNIINRRKMKRIIIAQLETREKYTHTFRYLNVQKQCRLASSYKSRPPKNKEKLPKTWEMLSLWAILKFPERKSHRNRTWKWLHTVTWMLITTKRADERPKKAYWWIDVVPSKKIMSELFQFNN